MNDERSYGPSLNRNGGGWCVDHVMHIPLLTGMPYRFAMERTTSFIKVWFWSRSGWDIPSDIRNGAADIILTTGSVCYSVPTADFCVYKMIIDRAA